MKNISLVFAKGVAQSTGSRNGVWPMSMEHFDIVIIGAGLSGIGAGYRLQTRCPGKRYVIFEARTQMGGT